MLRVKVRFFTVLRELAGSKEVVLSFEEETVTIQNVVSRLVEAYGREFKRYIYNPNGCVREFLQFLVNGRNIDAVSGRTLEDGDVLAIVPPVGGGWDI